jgi:hypothetical protein
MRGGRRGVWFGDWAIWALGENVGFNDSMHGCILVLKNRKEGRHFKRLHYPSTTTA